MEESIRLSRGALGLAGFLSAGELTSVGPSKPVVEGSDPGHNGQVG
jgi:hypothetical protein